MGSLDIKSMRDAHPGKSDEEAARDLAQKYGYIAIVRYKSASSAPDFTNIGTCMTEHEVLAYLSSSSCHGVELIYEEGVPLLRRAKQQAGTDWSSIILCKQCGKANPVAQVNCVGCGCDLAESRRSQTPTKGIDYSVRYQQGSSGVSSRRYASEAEEIIAADIAANPRRGCFIATVCYDTQSPSLNTLRRLRDQHLERTTAGRAFVSVYYRLSPTVARCLESHPLLKPVVRSLVLEPIVRLVRHAECRTIKASERK